MQFSAGTQNWSRFWPLHKNKSSSTPDIKTKLISHHWNQVNFDPHLMSIRCRCPDTKKNSYFDRDAENKLLSTVTHNQINTDPPHWNEVIFDNPHKNQIHFILLWNQVKFDPPHWNQVNLDHSQKMQVVLRAHTKNKWFSRRVQKPSQFRPPTQQNQFHPYTEVKLISIPTTKSSQFWSRDTKNKLISIPTLKPSLARPTRQNQVNFDPYIEIKSSPIPHINQVSLDTNTKTKSFSTPTQKPSQFRSAHIKQANFYPH